MVDIDYKKEKIGQILLSRDIITKEQLEEALDAQRNTGGKLGEILIKKGFISDETLVELISFQRGFESVDLNKIQDKIDPSIANLISKDFEYKRKIFPFELTDNTLYVAMVDPRDINVIDEIRLLTGYNVKPYISTAKTIDNIIRLYTSDDYSLREVQEIIKDEDFTVGKDVGEITEKNPLIRLSNQIILKAVSLRASDIHVEPQEKNCTIRFRIDGVLQKIKDVPKTVQRLLISRYKIMGGMDITESRLPQDGRSSINFRSRVIDLRLASIPTVYGENITIRILDKDESVFDLKKAGMTDDDIPKYLKMISLPHGSIIITGPTGSGKTTTLYASLSKIASIKKKIFTIEDPVEYRFPTVMQVQVNPKIDMSFSKGLRAFLRSDPDVILVGEIRDLETAKIAMEASITGHLVLTTLHTNDAPSSLTRLQEMGVDPYVISAAVSCIVAQRLVRSLCTNCKKEVDVPVLSLNKDIRSILKGEKIYKSDGCKRCNFTGYMGRTGIYSVLVVTKKIREMILEGKGVDEINDVAREEGMRTLLESGAYKVAEGLTSLEELYRVVF
ncbi:MAG: Flp pilus assembly complex ATPase component TadA [Chloroflexi bacterium]|nr:Flp pilus assembly complex ATPase component TadA [Chloroflexota bacterium]MBE3114256.1 Flp pilus assembly complex ATPase component TadA [Actinomycetota bacterium]